MSSSSHTPDPAITGEALIARIAELERAVGTARDLLTIHRALYAFVASSAPCNGLYVSHYDRQNDRRTCAFAVSEGEEQDVAELPPMPMTNSPHSRAVRTGEVVISTDFQAAVKGQTVVNLGLERDPRLPQSAVAVPMKVQGRTIGAFEVQSVEPEAYRREHVVLLQMAGNLCAIATENIRLLHEEQRLRERAQASERRFRALIEHSADATVALNGAFRFSYVSPGATRILGHTEAEFLGREVFAIVHPEDQPLLRERLSELTRNPWRLQHASFRCRHRDGTWRWLSGSTKNLLTVEGVNALVGNFQDITELRRAENDVRHMQKMESIGQLAGGVAHDFNNILTVIQARTSLLLEFEGTREELHESLREIHDAALRAAQLTRQLLAFGRKQSLTLRSTDLNQVVRNIEAMLRRLVGEDIALFVTCDLEIGRVEADASMMEQVLMNLAVNARDAMPCGGRLILQTSRWRLTAEQQHRAPDAPLGAEFVCVAMKDTGTGIRPEHLPRIFDPFFTTKEVGKGTGLGLATVYGIIRQHRGWIEVRSSPGEGAEFSVLLPVIKGASREWAPDPAATLPLPRGTETVLVVEDDATVRTMVQSVLRNCGYQVVTAATGNDALARWKAHATAVDLVITDLIMPGGLTGAELGAQLRAAEPKVKILYTSGYNPSNTPGYIDLSNADFLPKPYDAATLARRVREMLDRT